jgi:hypothetical protein
MNNSRYISLALLTAAVSFSAAAEDLKTEIKVDRTVVPAERAASRLSTVLPGLLSPTITSKPLSMTEYSEPSQLTTSIGHLDPAVYPAISALSQQRGYAAVGYFPSFNLGASAGYRFIDTDRTRLGAWLQYDGNSYKVDDFVNKIKNNTFTIGVDANQKFGENSQLEVCANYSNAAVSGPTYISDNNNTTRHMNFGDVTAKWWSRVGDIGYHFDASFGGFSFTRPYYSEIILSDEPITVYQPSTAKDLTYSIKGGLVGRTSRETWLGIELSGDFERRSSGDVLTKNVDDNSYYYPLYSTPIGASTLGIVSVMPQFGFHFDQITAHIGADVDFATGGTGKKVHIAPNVLVDWNPTSQLAIYAKVKGGQQLNTLRDLYDYTPFLPSAWVYDRSNVPVDAQLGVNVGPFYGASLELRGGYSIARDWMMPFYSSRAINGSAHLGGVTAFSATDIQGWRIGATVSYAFRNLVKLHASYDAAPQRADRGYYMWRDRAKYVVAAGAEITPIEKLSVNIDYEYRAHRACSYFTYRTPTELVDLGKSNNFSIGAAYKINDIVSVFARGENLFNNKYYILYGVSSQGTKGLVGVTVKF